MRFLTVLSSIFLSAILSFTSANAEWREVALTKPYNNLDISQCSFQLTHFSSIPAVDGMPSYKIMDKFPATHVDFLVQQSGTTPRISFGLPPYSLFYLFSRGEAPTVSESSAKLFYDLKVTGRMHEARILATLRPNLAPQLVLNYSGYLKDEYKSGSLELSALNFKLETSCNNKIIGDANQDQCVDIKDAYVWYSNILIRTMTNSNSFGAKFEEGDFDGNGILDGKDISVWSQNYNKGCNVQPNFQNVGQQL